MTGDPLAGTNALSHDHRGGVAPRLDKSRLAEDDAFCRLVEISDLEDWHEAFGVWLRAVRTLKREMWLAGVL